jgi:hypothetical protein
VPPFSSINQIHQIKMIKKSSKKHYVRKIKPSEFMEAVERRKVMLEKERQKICISPVGSPKKQNEEIPL